MTRIISEVFLSILAGSAALSLIACDVETSEIEGFADREAELDGDIDEGVDALSADTAQRPDDVAPTYPPPNPNPDDLAAKPRPPGPDTNDLTAETPSDDPDPGDLGDDPRPPTCACEDTYEPVCGVDGETYDNPCGAFCSGVEVAYEGKCDCLCTLIWDPVCGANGKTYGNACAAGCAGTDIAYEGVCTGDPCTADDDCAPNQFCQRDGACDSQGVCEIKADACFDKSAPICGCDGELYDSPCLAHAHGVSVGDADVCAINPDIPPEF